MPIGSGDLIDVLSKAGWIIRPGKGSHSVAISPDGTHRTTIPHCREIAVGTLGAIERQTGMKFRTNKRRA